MSSTAPVLRRGRVTANEKWGNAPSVLVGDFLYSRAFQLMVDLGQMDIMAILSDATNTIAEGEVMQLANVGNCQISEAEYMEVIRCKTALLFEASTHTAAVLASQDEAVHQNLRRFGSTSASPTSWWTTGWTTPANLRRWVKTWVTTWRRASSRCRSSTRWPWAATQTGHS